MKKVSKQEAFDNFADVYGPNWHREGPYRDEWEPYRVSWIKRHGLDLEKRRLRNMIDRRKDLNASQKADLKKRLTGSGIDIHKAIGRLPKPKSGWTLPGHKYTGPYNDLEKQVRYDKDTGEILEIYDKPTRKTDAIAMQHDVDYSVCGDDKECKHRADRQMVRALDAVPWRERQWGHWLARNSINTKRKLGLGVKTKRPKFKSSAQVTGPKVGRKISR